LRRKVHQSIIKVTRDLEGFSFNTAIAELMKLKNVMQDFRSTPVAHTEAWNEAIQSLLLMLAPFAPHIAEELWAQIGGPYSIHQQAWPIADVDIAADDVIELVVQVNGKVRDKIMVPADVTEDTAKAKALSNDKVQAALNGDAPQKVIYVPGRLVNIVV
jgi:leucyl-tRNA synthetase